MWRDHVRLGRARLGDGPGPEDHAVVGRDDRVADRRSSPYFAGTCGRTRGSRAGPGSGSRPCPRSARPRRRAGTPQLVLGEAEAHRGQLLGVSPAFRNAAISVMFGEPTTMLRTTSGFAALIAATAAASSLPPASGRYASPTTSRPGRLRRVLADLRGRPRPDLLGADHEEPPGLQAVEAPPDRRDDRLVGRAAHVDRPPRGLHPLVVRRRRPAGSGPPRRPPGPPCGPSAVQVSRTSARAFSPSISRPRHARRRSPDPTRCPSAIDPLDPASREPAGGVDLGQGQDLGVDQRLLADRRRARSASGAGRPRSAASSPATIAPHPRATPPPRPQYAAIATAITPSIWTDPIQRPRIGPTLSANPSRPIACKYTRSRPPCSWACSKRLESRRGPSRKGD